MRRTYVTPLAFKATVEQRLRNEAVQSGLDLRRLRQLLVFDRYLARVFAVLKDAVVLKGGLVVELRLARARTTRGIDLRFVGSADGVLPRLQEAGRLDLGDYLTFEVQRDPNHPEIDAEGMAYQGLRHRAQGYLAGKVYGAPFGIDVAFAEPLEGDRDVVPGSDFLVFAGVAPAAFRIYPLETHVAEKLHAYTLPRSRPNSRVKDLPDIALLASARVIDARVLRAAVDKTFSHRATHPVPARLPPPPPDWAPMYGAAGATIRKGLREELGDECAERPALGLRGGRRRWIARSSSSTGDSRPCAAAARGSRISVPTEDRLQVPSCRPPRRCPWCP